MGLLHLFAGPRREAKATLLYVVGEPLRRPWSASCRCTSPDPKRLLSPKKSGRPSSVCSRPGASRPREKRRQSLADRPAAHSHVR